MCMRYVVLNQRPVLDCTLNFRWKINEAFASQFAYCVQELAIPMAKINPK